MKLASFFLFILLNTCNQTLPMICQYADGSGNVYRLSKDTLHYHPMTPERSSSGTYSGGDPQSVELNKTEQEQLVALFGKVLDDNNGRERKRTMGSGRIRLDDRNCIIPMRSEAKKEVEILLKALLQK